MIPLAVIGGVAIVWCCRHPQSVIGGMAALWCSFHFQEGETISSKRAREIVKYEYENFG
jgi:hypothetical protein